VAERERERKRERERDMASDGTNTDNDIRNAIPRESQTKVKRQSSNPPPVIGTSRQ